MYQWKKGISLSFFGDLSHEILQKVRLCGFDCVELSYREEDYFDRFHFPETAEKLKEYCDSIGIELWSIHLPFYPPMDISGADAANTVKKNTVLIQAAARAGVSCTVIHPSFEPIEETERSARLSTAVHYLKELNAIARNEGVRLCLENLPRTCLGNTSKEMLYLLRETGASFLFDTNHSLQEHSEEFLCNMIGSGYCPASLHVSDYDFVDERHDLPGHGVNHWNEILDLLQEAGYKGPILYEIRHEVSPDRMISIEPLTENINLLLDGKIR